MRYKMINNMLQGFYNKQHSKMRGLYMDGLMDYNWDTKLVIIRIDHSWVLKFMARATILALVIVSLPWINMIIGHLLSRYEFNYTLKVDHHEMDYSPINLEFLPMIFQDLANERLLRMGDRSLLIVSNGNEEEIYNSQVVKDYNPDLISFSDSTKQNLVPNETFDFVYAYGYPQSSSFIERALKVGGILVVPLNDNPLVDEFPHPSNYKIVYVRKFDSTTVAMKKIKNASINSFTRRRLHALATNAEKVSGPSCGNRRLFDKEHLTSLTSHEPAQRESELVRPADITNAKKAALNKLEDVLLEPPRAASGKSSRYLKKTHFLPDLMGVSLESYPRRVFIDVGLQEENEKSSDNYHSTWFSKHYPTRNTKFEMFKIETVTEESTGKKIPLSNINMSDWLQKNVKENEYVVIKAEADVVEEMVQNKSVRLIDELFLECKHQGIKLSDKKNRRPYWECLSLYGLLRDEGIAVHQWWG